MVLVTGGNLPGGLKGDGGSGGGRGWAGEVKRGIKSEDSRIKGNGNGYKFGQVIK